MQFTYRPAGGNASLDLVVRNPGTKEPVEAGKNGALLVIGPEGPGFAALPRNDQRLRMTFPVKLLCQLRGARAATLTPHAGGLMSRRPTSKRSVDNASSSTGATAQKRHQPSEAAPPSSAP
jgi:hypothetical protein